MGICIEVLMIGKNGYDSIKWKEKEDKKIVAKTFFSMHVKQCIEKGPGGKILKYCTTV